MEIGTRIKYIRNKQKLTLEALSQETNLTKSLLSQIENHKANPSLKTLYAIASGLGVPIISLFEEDKHEESPVIRRLEREETSPIPGIFYQRMLPANRPKNIEFLYNIYKEHSSTGKLRTHKGIEFGVIIKGSLSISYDGKNYDLEEGDSIFIECSKPHKLMNKTNGDTEVIWVELPHSNKDNYAENPKEK